MDSGRSCTVKLSVNGGPARTLKSYKVYRIGRNEKNEFPVDHQSLTGMHAYAFKMRRGVTQIAALHGSIKVKGEIIVQRDVGLEDADENGNVHLQFGEVYGVLQITADPPELDTKPSTSSKQPSYYIKNPFPKYSEKLHATALIIPPCLRYRSKSVAPKNRKRDLRRDSSAPPHGQKGKDSSEKSSNTADGQDGKKLNMNESMEMWGDFDDDYSD
ncbi:uncharacterized protein LOC111071971 [Drosophila obscura]|uniref:uncharacterized protein LOC111071971 n=1 Tax=Drosophila obscura TaxID=7282 RepID=UPI001BB1F959|nr:uncharacterized protein LOC111071971 [Drosophila obscura]